MKAKITSNCMTCVHGLVCKHENEFVNDATQVCEEINRFNEAYPTLTLSISCSEFMGLSDIFGPTCEGVKK